MTDETKPVDAPKPCHDQFGHNSEACHGLDSDHHKSSMPVVDAPKNDARTWLANRISKRGGITLEEADAIITEGWWNKELELLEAYALPLRQKLEQAEKELHVWKVSLHDLTAGGSEFANDPKACVAYVRNRCTTHWELAKKAVIEKRKAESQLKRVRFIADERGHAPCRCGGIGEFGVCSNTCHCEWAKEIRAALEEK